MVDADKKLNDTPELRDAMRSIDAIREDEFGLEDSTPNHSVSSPIAQEVDDEDDPGADGSLGTGEAE